MKYKIEFELPDNETVRKKIDSTYINWSVWGFSGIAKAEPIDDPQTERRCSNCKFLTYRFNKVWCDIKCDNPHDVVCDKWERSSE